MRLQSEMQRNMQAREEVDAEASRLLDILEEVCDWSPLAQWPQQLALQIDSKWEQLPMEEIQSWALQTAESVSGTRPL